MDRLTLLFSLLLVGIVFSRTIDDLPQKFSKFHVKKIMESREEILEFWTPERIKEAKPKTLLLPPESRPEGVVDGRSSKRQLGTCREEYNTLTNQTRYSSYPLNAVGSLFFEVDKKTYRCSASIAEGTFLWTAGHCLYDVVTGEFSKKVNFMPGYYNGNAPFGGFPLEFIFVPPEWTSLSVNSNRIMSFDFAMGSLVDDVESVVNASFELAANLSPAEVEYLSLGYPSEAPFTGNYIHSCRSGSCGRDHFTTPAPWPVRIQCDSTGGSSGGPWLVVQSGRAGEEILAIAGLNSYGYADDPQSMYGPYFNTYVEDFYLAVTNGTRIADEELGDGFWARFLLSFWFYVIVSLVVVGLVLALVFVLRMMNPASRYQYQNVS